MKRLLLPLLASLAFLPVETIASNIYLSCSVSLQRTDDKPWKEIDNTIHEFTLNEVNQSGTVYFPGSGLTNKLALVNFQSESIIMGDSEKDISSTYTISRIDGSYFRTISIMGGVINIKDKGTCKKSEPKKTLF